MKKLLLSLTTLLLLANVKAQTPQKKQFTVGEKCKSVLSQLTELHKQTIKLFNEKNYDGAYPLATKMYEIAEANCLDEKDKRLSLALNIAEIQTKRGKIDEAREIFDKNLIIAEEVYGENSIEFNDYLTSLIKLSINEIKNEKFEQYALKSIAVKRKVFGDESYETAHELLRIAVFYRRLKKFETAEPYYLEAIALSDKMLSNEKAQKLAIVNQYRAFLLERYGDKEGGKKADDFMRNRSQEVYTTVDNSRVLNGMATKLFKPAYSSEAFVIRAKGKVEVQITIGENGKVIKAKAISGHPFLRQSSEQAAKASTFLPTYIDGKPVQVTGVIVYNF